MSSIDSYERFVILGNEVIQDKKSIPTLLLLAVGIILEKLSKVVRESRRPSAVFYAVLIDGKTEINWKHTCIIPNGITKPWGRSHTVSPVFV